MDRSFAKASRRGIGGEFPGQSLVGRDNARPLVPNSETFGGRKIRAKSLAGPVANTGGFRVSALVSAIGVAALLLIPGSSLALTRTMNIVTTMPQGEYRAGDWVTVTTHVLNLGLHENASTIDVYLNPGQAYGRGLEARPIGQGVYETTFQVLASDAPLKVARVFVTASIGSLQDFSLVSFSVDSLKVEVSAMPSRATLGSSVTVTVRVVDGSTLRDADRLFLSASVFTVGGLSESSDLRWSRRDVGTYLATYAIPDTITQDTVVSFYAFVAAGATASGSGLLLVDVPTTLVVWSHQHSLGSSGGVLEILVANETGWPAPGAAVSLTYAYYDLRPYLWSWKVRGTTDDRGVVSFNLAYPYAAGIVSFWGTASTGSEEQGFEGALTLPSSVTTRGTEIRRDTQVDRFAAGELTSVHYSLLRNGTARPSETIYFYARSREDLLANGVVTTDSSGRFDIAITLPSGSTTIEFALRSGASWLYRSDVVFAARSLPLNVGPLFVGSVTHLSASIPSASGPYLAYIALLPYTMAQGSLEFPWGLANGAWGVYEIAVSDGGAIEHDLVVPRFLPKGEDYVLYVSASPLTPASGEDTYIYAHTFTIENLPPTPATSVSSLRVGLGSSVDVDASASFDRDGTVEAYEIDWGDGASTGWTANASGSHAFARAGDYPVTVRVRDDSGAVNDLTLQVHVSAPALTAPPAEQLVVAAAFAAAASGAFVVVLRLLLRPPTARPRSGASRGVDTSAEGTPEAQDSPPPPLPPS